MKGANGSDHAWLGGSDITAEGNWTWVNGEPIGPWLSWYPGIRHFHNRIAIINV